MLKDKMLKDKMLKDKMLKDKMLKDKMSKDKMSKGKMSKKFLKMSNSFDPNRQPPAGARYPLQVLGETQVG
jgi:hypothetical protein